ncbi:hypothetical protein CRX72_20460 [Pantoea sp. BRM17]|nr:hypothetical protein CRX72_20460 [Pantoea sp. BRM17]
MLPQKLSGAPLGGHHEHDEPDYASDPDGDVIALDAHIRLANPRTPETADSLILRRGYSYSAGITGAGQLLGFKDGTANPDAQNGALMNKMLWVTADQQEPAWTYGGSYQAVRIIRFRVEQWDRTPLGEQQTIFGRDDSLDASQCHGDLLIQICANSQDTVIHALRDIIKHAPDLLAVRWRREGFIPEHAARSNGQETPINLSFLTQGGPAPAVKNAQLPPADSGILGATIAPDNLTLTLSVGSSLFDERFGLGAHKPAQLQAMTRFPPDAAAEHFSPGTVAPDARQQVQPFYGAHQAGILTPQQAAMMLVAFDVLADGKAELRRLLRLLTERFHRGRSQCVESTDHRTG